MSVQSIRAWAWVHKWTSLISTVFLLIICLTGLPLIFSEEIDQWQNPPSYENLPPQTPRTNLDKLAAVGRAMYPGQAIISFFVDDDEPEILLWMAPSMAAAKANPSTEHFIKFDARTAKVLETSKPPGQEGHDFMDIMLSLHQSLFLDLPGELFLGSMGLAFVLAIISGVVLYGPFTRRLDFGTLRTRRSTRLKWLDLHNLLGAVTLAWGLVVGATGVMNELSTPLFAIWQQSDVQELLKPWRGLPPVADKDLHSAEAVYQTGIGAMPGMNVTSLVYPGMIGSPYHYLLWGHGKTPLTAQLFSPMLIDARSGKVTGEVRMPWYLRTLEISRPLHFGNYGGLPLKILWALLDLVTIIVLISGLYLWVARRKRPVELDLPAAEPGWSVEIMPQPALRNLGAPAGERS